MKTAIMILLALAVTGLAGKHVPNSYTTYITIPAADVTKDLMKLVAKQSSTNNLRRTVSGPDLLVLKFVRYKDKGAPMPPPLPNDEPLDSKDLDYNEKLKKYKHAHKTTPVMLRKYKQYSYAQIQVEMKKPTWKPVVTNIVVERTP